MTERKPYPGDLTDEQWRHLHILLPRKRGKGNHRSPWQKRELLNAILSIEFTGGQWKAPPHDFPPHQTVYGYFRELSNVGIWQQINETLRRGVRRCEGR
ncbi:MAG: transposase, partial [Chloroflexota bacterium]